MSEFEAQNGPRVVITHNDLAPPRVLAPQPEAHDISVPARIACCLLIPFLPILCICAVAIRIAFRHSPAASRAWTQLFSTLLIASGLLTSAAYGWFWVTVAQPPVSATGIDLGLISHDTAAAFPSLPSVRSLAPAELMELTSPLVFIVLSRSSLPGGSSIGTATLLMANKSGYLLATNKHVAEPVAAGWLRRGREESLEVISRAGSRALAKVVGVHDTLDLALLWVERRGGSAGFRQPVAAMSSVRTGGPVFVVGHPHGLFFSLSNGLVSRLDARGLIQITAPVSPGNSGGPTWDERGNLLGIVTFTFDKQQTPNAENLNFSTRADAFLAETGWKFRAEGRNWLREFMEGCPGA